MLRVESPGLRRDRMAIAALFLVNGAVFGTWATHIPVVKAVHALSPSVLGLALLALAAGALTAMPACGVAMGRFGARRVLGVTGLAFSGLLALLPVMPHTAGLFVALFLFGASGGAMDVAMNAHGSAVERQFGRPILSSLHGMWSLGGLIGAGLGGLGLALLPAAIEAAILAIVFAGIVLAAIRHIQPRLIAAGNDGPKLALPDRRTVAIGAVVMFAFMAEGALLDWSAVYLREALDVPASSAGLGFAVFSGAMAISRFLGDRIRRRVGPVMLVAGGALLAAASLALGIALNHPLVAIPAFGLAGLGLANVAPVGFSTASARSADDPAQAVAAVATLGYGGVLIGPVMLGFVADATSLSGALSLTVGLCLLIACGAGTMRGKRFRPAIGQ
ncbi:MFS transporter [Chelatococcus asaccharovorans]|uniref:MFS transporter n=1 Tax=Chelatococcus asaccharovorans TaxID=28210 RepID=UPI00224C70AD|nr:MFS transporter [Chelatococcus asaccharovorans]CAH1658906.1 Fucose permease [Chelatococcus asaccharovorans]CAH1684359.1 Fucose permease [Chelatococcus asaccharovorans]